MKILSYTLSITLIVFVFLTSSAVSEKYRCKNSIVFQAYVHSLIKSHNNKKSSKTFSCKSLLSLERWFDSKTRIKFVKNKNGKYLKYRKEKHHLGFSNGLR
ncbi:hypothetical protein M902_1050 [Bacteriovorax sp. BAL6_X]|uniref:hypothetical protein n=1 Tax=Bacteriovorax sp. BAL6_X TaxID=1201290 RepID=UPI00038681C7|nr:hypothetical protein [Bacteriovorax sp. BAL6_X]EPZ49867.1 hypothetical protein M902_1050 [Bacteriovorax sp. BAL6_X]